MSTNKNQINTRLTITPLDPKLTLLTLDHNTNYHTTSHIQYYPCIYILPYYQSENHNDIITWFNLTILKIHT